MWRRVGEELGGGHALLQRCNLPEESENHPNPDGAASQESHP